MTSYAIDSGFTTVHERPCTASRYEPPALRVSGTESVEGCCFSCRHMAELRMDGRIYCICVQERDEHDKNEAGYFGEIFECDLDSNECKDWKWDGCSTASDRP